MQDLTVEKLFFFTICKLKKNDVFYMPINKSNKPFLFFLYTVVVLKIGYCVDVPTTKVIPKTTKVVKTTTLIDTNGTTIRMNLTRTKCFPFVGCFDNLPPFDNAALDLPRSPKEVGTQMQLFTRKNPKTELQHGYFLDFMDLDTINNSPFNHTRKTKFIIHGFTNSIKTPWIYEMKDELLKLVSIGVFFFYLFIVFDLHFFHC